jgi:nucleotidyltransferase/DNA polymerase involved in DNA repair
MRRGVRETPNGSLRALQTLPGVGPSIARDLVELGVFSPQQLAGMDPQALYDRFCAMKGTSIDRCLLYAFRCAEHAARTGETDPEKRKWWHWKDA